MGGQTALFLVPEAPEPSAKAVIGEDSARTGQLTELRFEVFAIERKWEVAKPLDVYATYDYLLRLRGEWRTIQVKTAGLKKGRPRVNMSRRRRYSAGGVAHHTPYADGDFDYLFTMFQGSAWLIPWEAIRGMQTVTMSLPRYRRYLVE